MRKGLIVYASHTGNTERVALRFQKVFEEKGWACDCIKAARGMKPVNPDDYALVCIGSPILAGVHAKEISTVWTGGVDSGVLAEQVPTETNVDQVPQNGYEQAKNKKGQEPCHFDAETRELEFEGL